MPFPTEGAAALRPYAHATIRPTMPAHLFCKTGEFAGATFAIAEEATIGRGPDGGVTVPAELVSGRHARIYFDEGEGAYFLEDLGSRNGTRLDGQRVTDSVKLGPLHVVTLADRIDLIYREGNAPSPTAPTPAPKEDRTTRMAEMPALALPSEDDAPVPKEDAPGPEGDAQKTQFHGAFAPPLPGTGPMDAATIVEAPRFALAVGEPGQTVETVFLVEGENTVGRAPECAVTLDAASVSRQHAVLTVCSGRVTVRDLGSRNKTFLNGEPVTDETEVPPGGALRFGIEIEARLRRA